MKPGEIITKKGDLDLNKDSETIKLKVSNSGDRPIQVGSNDDSTDKYVFSIIPSLNYRSGSLGMISVLKTPHL